MIYDQRATEADHNEAARGRPEYEAYQKLPAPAHIRERRIRAVRALGSHIPFWRQWAESP